MVEGFTDWGSRDSRAKLGSFARMFSMGIDSTMCCAASLLMMFSLPALLMHAVIFTS